MRRARDALWDWSEGYSRMKQDIRDRMNSKSSHSLGVNVRMRPDDKPCWHWWQFSKSLCKNKNNHCDKVVVVAAFTNWRVMWWHRSSAELRHGVYVGLLAMAASSLLSIMHVLKLTRGNEQLDITLLATYQRRPVTELEPSWSRVSGHQCWDTSHAAWLCPVSYTWRKLWT